MHRWRRWRKSLALAALFAAGALAVGVLFPACNLLHEKRRRAVRDTVTMAWYRAAGRVLGLRIQVAGRPLEPGVLAANHISWLDVIALGGRQPLAFVAKSEVAGWPVIGYLARQSGTLFIRRGDAAANRAAAETMAWRLRRGETLVLFPEGTTTRGDRVLRFHARLFQPAVAARVPVQPVAIEYRGPAAATAPFIGDDDFLPHLWRLLAEPEIAVVLRYGTALAESASRDRLAREAHEWVREALGLTVCASATHSATGFRRVRDVIDLSQSRAT